MRSSSTSAAVSGIVLGMTANAFVGHPASRMICPSLSADTGVLSAGRIITGLPAAIAGAALCATSSSGKLNGVIPATGRAGRGHVRLAFSITAAVERQDLA